MLSLETNPEITGYRTNGVMLVATVVAMHESGFDVPISGDLLALTPTLTGDDSDTEGCF